MDCFIGSDNVISPYLVAIFNYIFDRDVYPDLWRKGVIDSISKKGDKSVTLSRNHSNKYCCEDFLANTSQ